ncbi:alpha/beta fold hydrolase [Candidatus Seongchinamella marina]|uniref:alpha/beta fold hydrolase n=1 Tax=Candidatus Seongchinamella marina TaxID=2518990 RepID=UPI003C12B659
MLVGFSAGGIHVRSFYAKYPQKVRGIVFVESSHEDQSSRLKSRRPLQRDVPLYSLCDKLAWTGIIRITGIAGLFATLPKGSPQSGLQCRRKYPRFLQILT